MIDIDLPTLRKSWHSDGVKKPSVINRVFEHDLVDKAMNDITREFSEDSTSLTFMKTVKGVHIIGCLGDVEYPLRDIKLLEILKKYTDPSYMTKTLKDPTRGFCDKIAEVSKPPFDTEWQKTRHLKQAQRIDMMHMYNRNPAERITLFRRVLAENLSFQDADAPPPQQLGPRYPTTWDERSSTDNFTKMLVQTLLSCIMNTKNSGVTKYMDPNSSDKCQSYVIQTGGCNKNEKSDAVKNLEGEYIGGTFNKASSKFSIPKPFEEFEVKRKPTINPVSTIIFDLFQKLLDDCWEYSGKYSREGISHIFNMELKQYLIVTTEVNDIKLGNIHFTDMENNEFVHQIIPTTENEYRTNNVCNSLSKPSTYRLTTRWVQDAEKTKIANITQSLKNRIGMSRSRVLRSLAEQSAAIIPNNDLENPHPDRLNLTDDKGPAILENYTDRYSKSINLTGPWWKTRQGSVIVEEFD